MSLICITSVFLNCKINENQEAILNIYVKWFNDFTSPLTHLLTDMTASNLTVNIKFT
jgi:hypothetical protein